MAAGNRSEPAKVPEDVRDDRVDEILARLADVELRLDRLERAEARGANLDGAEQRIPEVGALVEDEEAFRARYGGLVRQLAAEAVLSQAQQEATDQDHHRVRKRARFHATALGLGSDAAERLAETMIRARRDVLAIEEKHLVDGLAPETGTARYGAWIADWMALVDTWGPSLAQASGVEMSPGAQREIVLDLVADRGNRPRLPEGG